MSREDDMVVLRRDDEGKPTVWCDPEVADLVEALNTGSLATVASCSGHGHRPGFIALADGRVLLVCDNLEQAKDLQRHRQLGFDQARETIADFLLSESEERLKDGCERDAEVMAECAAAIRTMGKG